MQIIDRDRIQKQYDRYVTYYNESKAPISSYAELLTIKAGLQQRLKEIKEMIDLYIDDIEYYLNGIFESTLSPDETEAAEDFLESNHERLIENIIEYIEWGVDNFIHISHPDEFMNHSSNQIRKVCQAYSQPGQAQKSIRVLQSIIWYGKKYERAFYHLRGAQVVADKIIDKNYPPKLLDYRDLEDHEKEELLSNKKAGAPMNTDVPQDEVEKIVTKLLHQYKRGQTILTNRNGQKRMYKIVHESGKYEGNVNINQIFKYIETAHPELINISDRQFKKRIKKAVPEGMK